MDFAGQISHQGSAAAVRFLATMIAHRGGVVVNCCYARFFICWSHFLSSADIDGRQVNHPWKPAVRRTNLIIIFFADLVSEFSRTHFIKHDDDDV